MNKEPEKEQWIQNRIKCPPSAQSTGQVVEESKGSHSPGRSMVTWKRNFTVATEFEALHTMYTLVNKLGSHSTQDGGHNNSFSIVVIRKKIKQPNLEPSSYIPR